MMAGKKHRIDCELYGKRFYVTFCRDTASKALTDEMPDSLGATFTDKNDYIWIYIQPENGDISINTVAHEAFHAVDYMMHSIGAEHNDGGTNEHWAYMIGWLCDKIVEKFRKDMACAGS